MSDQKTIELQLTIEETNRILDALGDQPFKQVFQLINKIQQQAAGQLNGQAERVQMTDDKTQADE